MKKEIPRYVKCLKQWNGKQCSVIGVVYDTSIPPVFSIHAWDFILLPEQNSGYFIETTNEPNFIFY